MAIESRSHFINVITPGLFALGVDAHQRYIDPWKQYVTTATSKKAKEELSYVSGLSLGRTKLENNGIQYDNRIAGPTVTIVHDTVGLGLEISEEMIEDGLYSEMEDGMKALGRSAAETRNIRAFDIFNSTTKTSADGQVIFYGSHNRLDLSTYSNLYTATSLDQDTLQDDIAAFEALTDERGMIVNREGSCRIVLVNPAQRWKMAALFKSELNPGSSDNAINTFKSERGNITFACSPYITSTTARFYIGEKSRIDGPIHFTRRPVTFAKDSNFETGSAKFKYTFRDSIGCCRPFNIAKNAGA